MLGQPETDCQFTAHELSVGRVLSEQLHFEISGLETRGCHLWMAPALQEVN